MFESSLETRMSLLDGLKVSSDERRFNDCWTQFVARYMPRMVSWAASRGLNRSDAEAVCQDLMGCLIQRLKVFPYDPSGSFKAWLNRVTKNAASDFRRRAQKCHYCDSVIMQQIIESQQVETLVEECFDLELLEEAKRNVARDSLLTEAGQRNWNIFLRLHETNDIGKIAEEYGVPRHTVSVVKNRILERIRNELERLRGTNE